MTKFSAILTHSVWHILCNHPAALKKVLILHTRMEITAKTLAEVLGGEVVGNPSVTVTGPARIEQGREGTVCFYANPKYEQYVYRTKASILLVNKDFEPKTPISATLVKVDDAYASVAKLLTFFSSLRKSHLIGNRFWARLRHDTTVSLSARIGKGTHIYPQVYVGPRVKIGKNCILYPGVRVYHDCVIGDNCIIHGNAVIGADGFGFAPKEDGAYDKIPQLGNVVLEDNVEIGACTTVDRATMGSTIVRKGVKIDNLCQVAHNVEMGSDTVMAALSGIAGSARIGSNCVIGGQSGVQGHISVANHTTLAGRTGVIGNVRKEGETLLGYPAIDHQTYMRAYALFKRSGSQNK